MNRLSDTFEVDIFSKDPLECTTYLREEERDKVKKLVRIKTYFEENSKERNIRLLFVKYDIHKSIRAEIVKFCQLNKIELIVKSLD